jgi:C4-dicarboxylate transporter, DcuC family
MQSILGLLVVAGVIALLVRKAEVRLVLLGAGALLGLLAGQPLLVLDVFGRAMVAGLVAPICAAMGFAQVMSRTGCDQQLVELLARPLRRAGPALIPGCILATFLVNAAIPSQASTAATVGPILVPLMQASGLSLAQAGAALILGASFGGDLLNPAAQDPMAIAGTTGLEAALIQGRAWPACLVGVILAALVFQWRVRRNAKPNEEEVLQSAEPVKLNLAKALLPLVPLILLVGAYLGFGPFSWLIATPTGPEWEGVASGLPVVRAMLLGVAATGLVCWGHSKDVARYLFEGMGDAYASIISLTITAQCFGAGLAAIGLADLILSVVSQYPQLALAVAILFPFSLSLISGSGSGPVLTFAQTLLVKMGPELHPERLASLASLAGGFGRTLSPVSAVVIYSSGLVKSDPRDLLKWLALPMLAGGSLSFLVAIMMP